MRRMRAVTVAGLLLACLAACSSPPDGTDGDLIDGWSAPPAPQAYRPAAGECHEIAGTTGSPAENRPVKCTDLHVTETFHVGTAAEAPVPPVPGSAGARTAYAECSEKAVAFLGGPWRGARVGVRIAWPTRGAWTGGQRWFRCDAVQADLDGGGESSRTTSLAGELAKASPLKLGCFDADVTGATVRSMTPVACTARHAAEFTGLWTAPDISYDEQVADRVRTAAACRSAIAGFAGLPDDNDVQYRTGWISYHPSRPEWQNGERRIRCFLWFADRSLTRSMRGAGPGALPVR